MISSILYIKEDISIFEYLIFIIGEIGVAVPHAAQISIVHTQRHLEYDLSQLGSDIGYDVVCLILITRTLTGLLQPAYRILIMV